MVYINKINLYIKYSTHRKVHKLLGGIIVKNKSYNKYSLFPSTVLFKASLAFFYIMKNNMKEMSIRTVRVHPSCKSFTSKPMLLVFFLTL